MTVTALVASFSLTVDGTFSTVTLLTVRTPSTFDVQSPKVWFVSDSCAAPGASGLLLTDAVVS